MIDGLVSPAGAVRAAESNQRQGALLIERLTEITLIHLISAGALITGVMEILNASQLRE